MANKTQRLKMTRGDTRTINITIPAGATPLATPIDSLEFCAAYLRWTIHKEVGDGITITSEDDESIVLTIDLDEEDTTQLPNRDIPMKWDLKLVEADGNISHPIGGTLTVLSTAECD